MIKGEVSFKKDVCNAVVECEDLVDLILDTTLLLRTIAHGLKPRDLRLFIYAVNEVVPRLMLARSKDEAAEILGFMIRNLEKEEYESKHITD